MMEDIARLVAGTLVDVAPIVVILAFFQIVVLRRPIPQLRRVAIGLAHVLVGLALFLFGLEEALFPLGETMARQLTDPAFLFGDAAAPAGAGAWHRYYWVYAFAAALGFSATVAEPALIAVSIKAGEASGGAFNPFALRIAVAIGVSASLAIGTFRIVTGTPLYLYMIAGYLVVIAQTLIAPRAIIPLAYDSGGVTTSTVTVPLVAALGLGLASTIPGRSPLLDGFGLIALASLFPMITVMGYAQASVVRAKWKSTKREGSGTPPNGEMMK